MAKTQQLFVALHKTRTFTDPSCPSLGQIFWDMDNCGFNNVWPGPSMFSHKWTSKGMMSPRDHYNLLVRVFVKWCGVKADNFRIHAVMARTSLELLSEDVQINMQWRHERVNLQTPPGALPGAVSNQPCIYMRWCCSKWHIQREISNN